jgi:hypothetical protein
VKRLVALAIVLAGLAPAAQAQEFADWTTLSDGNTVVSGTFLGTPIVKRSGQPGFTVSQNVVQGGTPDVNGTIQLAGDFDRLTFSALWPGVQPDGVDFQVGGLPVPTATPAGLARACAPGRRPPARGSSAAATRAGRPATPAAARSSACSAAR